MLSKLTSESDFEELQRFVPNTVPAFQCLHSGFALFDRRRTLTSREVACKPRIIYDEELKKLK